ncbi:MAG: transglycosylase domain-containing protein, partial [Bradymonadaceae bacterium]
MARDSHSESTSAVRRWLSDRPAGLRWGALGLAVAVGLLLAAYWFAVPPLAETILRNRLDTVEARTGTAITFDGLEVSAFEGTKLQGLRISALDRTEPIARLEMARVQLAPYPLLWGRPVVTSLTIRGARLFVRRRSDGRVNLLELADAWSGDDSGATIRSSGGSSGGALLETILRPFGGEWPELEVTDAAVAFEGGGWPVHRLETSSVTVEPAGETADVRGSVRIERGPARPNWSLPDGAEFNLRLRRPLSQTTGQLSLKSALEISGVPPYRFLRLGTRGLEIEAGPTVTVRAPSLGIQGGGEAHRVFDATSISVAFNHAPGGLRLPGIDDVTIEGPTLQSGFDRQHAGALKDLIHLYWTPDARHVASTAERVADRHASDETDTSEGDASPGSGDASGATTSSPLTRIAGSRFLPSTVQINGATVRFRDRRQMDLVDPDPVAVLREGNLTLERTPTDSVEIEGGFRATTGDDERRGRASVDVDLDLPDRRVEGTVSVEDLSLTWLAQIGGPRVAAYLQGGRLTASAQVRWNEEKTRHEFECNLELKQGYLDLPVLATERLSTLDAGYDCAGHVDRDKPMPAPELLEWRELTPDEAGSESKRETAATEESPDAGRSGRDGGLAELSSAGLAIRGTVVVEKGRATLNGLKADIRPAVYGLAGFDDLPTRLDLSVDFERRDVQAVFDRIPAAVKGSLSGAKMKGTFAWTLDLELPVHNADRVEWRARPSLRGFELVSLPDEVDVREMTGSFEHVIRGEEFDFERRVQIPPMRPTPTSWLTEHGGLGLEEIDRRRRERKWPKPPSPSASASDGSAPSRSSPNIWTVESMRDRAADRPWSEDQPLASIDKLDFPPDVDTRRERVDYLRSRIERRRRKLPDRFCPPSQQPCLPQTGSTGSTTGPRLGDTKDGLGLQPSADARGTLSLPASANGASTETTGSTRRSSPSAGSTEATSPPPWNETAIVDIRGRERIYPYGPYVYTPLHHVSKWVPLGVMTTEDNSLFEHHGFNWYAIEESLEENIDERGFVRGASTVSMQLIKNLYLSFDKVLARKFREAFLVWLMEDVVDVPKARILEIYLNIIEFGPAIYGIGAAARHYFDKDPAEPEFQNEVRETLDRMGAITTGGP